MKTFKLFDAMFGVKNDARHGIDHSQVADILWVEDIIILARHLKIFLLPLQQRCNNKYCLKGFNKPINSIDTILMHTILL